MSADGWFTACFLPLLELDISIKLVQYFKLKEVEAAMITVNISIP